jgi:hypothetical protein
MRSGGLYAQYFMYVDEKTKIRITLPDAIEKARKLFLKTNGYPALKCEYNVLDYEGVLEIDGLECIPAYKGMLLHHFVLYPLRDPVMQV